MKEPKPSKEIQITTQDENYFYIKVTKVDGITNQKEVEIATRRKTDKTKDIIKRAKELLE